MKLIFVFTAVLATFGSFAQKAEWSVSSGEFPKKVYLFPNPASEFLTLTAEGMEVNNLTIGMFNIIGNEVAVEADFSDGTEIRIRVKDLPSGYYLISIRDEKTGQRTTKKFLKR